MSQIFISYSRRDRNIARRLKLSLASIGIEVDWDESMPSIDWQLHLEKHIDILAAVVVIWSENSVYSDSVRDEARLAKNKNKLINVILDVELPPWPFDNINGLPLGDWKGHGRHRGWEQLVASIAGFIEKYEINSRQIIADSLAKQQRKFKTYENLIYKLNLDKSNLTESLKFIEQDIIDCFNNINIASDKFDNLNKLNEIPPNFLSTAQLQFNTTRESLHDALSKKKSVTVEMGVLTEEIERFELEFDRWLVSIGALPIYNRVKENQDPVFFEVDEVEGSFMTAMAVELAQPVQNAAPLVFTDRDEQLHIDPNARGDGMLNDDVGRKLHGEVVRLARKLQDTIAGGHGGNSTLALAAENDLLIDRLGAAPADADPHLLVCSAISIDILLDSQPKAKDDDSDIPAFPDDVLMALRGLVPIANIYLSTDQKLAAIYQGRTGPSKPLIILATPAEIIAAIVAAQQQGVSGQDVTDVLSAIVKTAPDKPDRDDPGTLRASRETQSLIRRVTGKLLANAKTIFKNSERIDVVAGWFKDAAEWLYQQRQLVAQVFRDRPEVMNALREIWEKILGFNPFT